METEPVADRCSLQIHLNQLQENFNLLASWLALNFGDDICFPKSILKDMELYTELETECTDEDVGSHADFKFATPPETTPIITKALTTPCSVTLVRLGTVDGYHVTKDTVDKTTDNSTETIVGSLKTDDETWEAEDRLTKRDPDLSLNDNDAKNSKYNFFKELTSTTVEESSIFTDQLTFPTANSSVRGVLCNSKEADPLCQRSNPEQMEMSENEDGNCPNTSTNIRLALPVHMQSNEISLDFRVNENRKRIEPVKIGPPQRFLLGKKTKQNKPKFRKVPKYIAAGDHGEQFQCPVCYTIVAHKTNYYRHFRMVHLDAGVMYPCEICGIEFTTTFSVQRHMSHHHR